MNIKTGQGSYIVIFGVLKKGWTLKAPFIRGYLGTLVERMNSRKNTSINVEHCETYYEFNIKKVEFGNESLWLRLPPKNGKSGNTVNSLSAKSVLAGEKLVATYSISTQEQYLIFYVKQKLGTPKSTYRHNAQIGKYRTILTSKKKIQF